MLALAGAIFERERELNGRRVFIQRMGSLIWTQESVFCFVDYLIFEVFAEMRQTHHV